MPEKPYHPDAKDYRLLHELDLDSRQTLAKLGRKVRLSKQVVDYRLKRLVSSGVISRFYAVLDISKMGYAQYKFYFKLQNANSCELPRAKARGVLG